MTQFKQTSEKVCHIFSISTNEKHEKLGVNEQTSIKRQELIQFRLHRDSQEQFSTKGVPSNFQKTEIFLRIIQQLEE